MQTTTTSKNILALDVGEQRVGVAVASTQARLARPLTTLSRGASFWSQLEQLIRTEAADLLLVGLPRNLQGLDTDQTRATQQFITELNQRFGLPIVTQDEALTSRQAEAELNARGKPFTKGDIDALAATYILEDYLKER